MSPGAEPAASPPPPDPAPAPLVNRRLVKAFYAMFLYWLIVAPIHGLVLAQKLNHEFMEKLDWEQWGRVRPFHVNGVIFGVFSMGVLASLYYFVPRLTGVRMFAERAGWFVLVAWNLALHAGIVQMQAGWRIELITPQHKATLERLDPVFADGYDGAATRTWVVEAEWIKRLGFDLLPIDSNTGVEAGELPVSASLVIHVCLLVLTVQMVGTLRRRTEPFVYASLWYAAAAFVWTDLNLLLGVMLPFGIGPGITNAAVHGLYIHYVVGLWITPIGLALVYYLLPLAVRAPLYSHKLSLIGFWSLAFFYPFVGTHHYLFSPIVGWAQTLSIVMGMMLIVPVWAVAANFFGTLRGHWRRLQKSPAVKFLVAGMVWYLLGTFQGSTQALRAMQKPTHFSDYVIAHSHLTVFGTFVVWTIAGAYHIWPRVTGRRLYSLKLASWHFWLTVFGFSMMALSLSAAGLIQGTMLSPDGKQPGADWLSTVSALRAWWDLRSVAGTMMFAGMVVFVWNLVKTARRGEPRPNGHADRPTDDAE